MDLTRRTNSAPPPLAYRTLSGHREPLMELVGVTGELPSHRIVVLLTPVLLLQFELALLNGYGRLR